MKPRLAPRSILGLFIVVALTTGLVTFVLTAVATLFFHRELERQLDQRIEVETNALLAYYAQNGFEGLVRVVSAHDLPSAVSGIGYLAGIDDRERAMGYIVVDAKGRRRAGALDAAIPPPGWSEFVRFRKADGSIGEAQAVNSALRHGGRLVVAADRSVIKRMHRSMLELFGWAYGALLLLSTIAMFGFGRVIRRRLTGIERSAEAIMAGDLSRRMPVDGSGSEFDRLSLVLNSMLDRIGALVDNLRQVSGDLAHDLRTPLQRVRGRLEAMAASDDGAPLRPDLDAAIRETDELLELFSSLLAISEIEGNGVQARFDTVVLDETVAGIIDIYRAAIEEGGRSLAADIAPATIRGDAKLLERLLANLLDNASIHTPPGSAINVTLTRDRDQAILTVSDDGPGIPASEQEWVFRRFTRRDASRSTPGHGLGLNLVAAVAQAHRGDVAIIPSAIGLTVRVALPIAG